VTLTATISPTAATGTITFYDGTTSLGTGALSSGTATLATTFTTTGSHSITADYGGSTTYASSNSNSVTITVSASSSSSTDCGLQDSTNSAYATAADPYTSGTNTLASPTISVANANESAICVQNSGTTLAVTSPTIVSSSVGSNQNDGSFYGTDAAVLAYGSSATTATGGSITITGGTINATGQYGNGAFASGDGATVTLSGTSITATGGNAHGVDAAEGGALNLTNVTATTFGQSGSVVATDQGGGTVTVNGGTYTANGYRSAGIYSTGVFNVTNGTFTANDAEAVVVEGNNSVTLTGAKLASALGDDRGVFLYQSTSGDASTGTASFTMTNGSISYTCPVTATSTACAGGATASGQNNPATLFAIANTTATISLTDVTVTNSTSTTTDTYGTLLTAAALNPGTWGTAGADGGNVTFTAKGETLVGDVIVDSISTAALTLNEDSSGTASSLTGAINSANTGKTVSLTLDATSTWVVTGTSYLTTLTDSDTTYANIKCETAGCKVYNGTTLISPATN
jgi:hypothetical protein